MIDFHTHSYYSDGTLSPTDLVRLAKNSQITKLALTDHDTVSGLAEAELEAKKQDIQFVKGIEISSFDKETPSIHILGLKLNNLDVLSDLEKKNKESRRKRTMNILESLQKFHNIRITYEELLNVFKGTIGNGNLAQYMVYKKYCSDFATADKIVQGYKGVPYGIRVEKAIRLIHQAGGLAFLAHPYSLRLSTEKLINKLDYFKQMGLDGVEYSHSNHTEEQKEHYLQLAKSFGLLLTAGSDFHGAYKPSIKLGLGKGVLPLGQEDLITW